jgi:hypothetical protein
MGLERKHHFRAFSPNGKVMCLWTLLLFLMTGSLVVAAEKHPAGRDIFRQECSKCHGRKGEGVKGKYEGPLRGERSLEKLTRYIERNMPDDNPGKLATGDAAAVAHYIYETFYSREARVRSSKPPRVELVRLTNLQYLNSVADLFKEFSGKDDPVSKELGLQATYYSSRDFAGDKKSIERVERQVDFDYGGGAPDEKLQGTNGFSMQWRGSIRTDETGDYEFIVKTPNGARLWVNDNVEPLIDAWVASGQITEHKATIRLIGGRVYPIRLNYFKFKEKRAAISLQWKPPHGAQQPVPARNLSPGASTPTLVVGTAFPPDDSSLGYERGVSVSKAWDEATTSAAIEVANYVANNLERLSASKPEDTNRMAKVEAFCTRFVEAAFHRPLTEQQKRIYVRAQFRKPGIKAEQPKDKEQKDNELEDAVKRVALLTLKSPRFLYCGLDNMKPDDFEVAARLSYTLWDSIPDQDLRKAAGKKEMHTRDQIERATNRMLVDARVRAKIQGFFHHWLQMDRVENLSKDDKLFPGFTPEIISDLRTSLDIFLEDTMWGSSSNAAGDKSEAASDYRTLLSADYLFLNNRLAAFYGGSTNAADDYLKLTLGPKERSGVLTHPYLLAAFSYQKLTSPIHRGVFLTRNIVGRSLKPPPMAMTFKDADFAPNLTMRQKVSQLTRGENCQSCHSVINPLGFSLEQYDAVGRLRTSENNQPIDAASDYLTDDGQTIRFTGPRDVAEFAIGSEQAQNAFIQQLFHHLVKQPLQAYGADAMSRLRKSFVASEFNMQKLVVEMVVIAALQGVE